MAVSAEDKIVAKHALKAFGGTPKVYKYWDNNDNSNIDIAGCIDRPDAGVTSYATLGLHNYSIDKFADDKELRVEIVGACATETEFFPNMLSTCAFCVINSKYTIFPGKVFLHVVKEYYPDIEMKHILFTSPFLWDEFETIDFPDIKIAWLLAVPISENEFLFAEKNGYEALEDLFEENEIDIFDIYRQSVL